jgi:hypothetical protein
MKEDYGNNKYKILFKIKFGSGSIPAKILVAEIIARK